MRADTYAKLGRAELERAARPPDEARRRRGADPAQHLRARVGRAGRTHMALGAALELAQGAVVELDQAAEAPVELFANGLCFANGKLVVTGDGRGA